MTGHGGKRPGSGRPRKPESERLVKRCIAMTPAEWAHFDRCRPWPTPGGDTMRAAMLRMAAWYDHFYLGQPPS